MMFTSNLYAIYFLMIGVGIMWGSLVTLPYVIILADIQPDKVGVSFGIFNITITVPQILCGLVIGSIVKYVFLGHAIFAIGLSGILIGISGIILFYQEGINILKGLYLSINNSIRCIRYIIINLI